MAAFDVIIIGSGSSGISAAESALEAGAKKVAIIEKAARLGGECPNRGCVPTKALLRSVEVLSLAQRGKSFGLRIPKTGFSFPNVMARMNTVIDRSTGGKRIEKILTGLGVTLIKGRAKFTGPNGVIVGKVRHTAKKIIIATGSVTFVPPIEGLKKVGFLTSDDVVKLKKLPKSVIMIGGGPIGVEWAQIFHGLGSKVTIVEFMPHLLPREDEEIAEIVRSSFVARKIGVMTSTKVVRVEKKGRKYIASTESAKGGGGKQISAEAVMIATGKRVALGGMDIEKAGVKLDEKGRPVLNAALQTSNPNIYIVGDAAGQMMFTHVAHYHGTIAGTNAVKGNRLKSDLSVVPRGTFCTPEVGSVGMTEEQALEKGFHVGVGKAPYGYLGKASVMDEPEGLVKLVVDMKTKKILGGHICGHSAAEIIHEVALAISAGLKYTAIADMIHAYPTFAEGVGAAAYNVE